MANPKMMARLLGVPDRDLTRPEAAGVLGDPFDPRDTSGGPPSGAEAIKRSTARDVSYGQNYVMPEGTGKGGGTGTLTRRAEVKAGPLSPDVMSMALWKMMNGNNSPLGGATGSGLIQAGINRGDRGLIAAGVELAKNESEGHRFDRGLASREKLAGMELDREDKRSDRSERSAAERLAAQMLDSREGRELQRALADRTAGIQELGLKNTNENARAANDLARAGQTQQGQYQNAMLGLEGQKLGLARDEAQQRPQLAMLPLLAQLIGGSVQSGDTSLGQGLSAFQQLGSGKPVSLANDGGGGNVPRLGMNNKELVADLNKRYGEASSLRNFLDKLPFGYTQPEQKEVVHAFLKGKFGDTFNEFLADDSANDWFKVGKYDRNKQTRLKSKVGVSGKQEATPSWAAKAAASAAYPFAGLVPLMLGE